MSCVSSALFPSEEAQGDEADGGCITFPGTVDLKMLRSDGNLVSDLKF